MLQAVRNQSITPPPATRAFAMAHTAGFLAVNGIQKSYDTPFKIERGPTNADPEIAYGVRADKLNNPDITGQGQTNWRSLIFTPDFPAYTSGHSAFSGVSARMIANFIGTDAVNFSAEAPDLVNWPKQLTGVRRSWTSLWQAAEENGASRIYGGVHWDADNIEGLKAGKNLADYVYNNAFQKVV
jgi:hypothetical protein